MAGVSAPDRNRSTDREIVIAGPRQVEVRASAGDRAPLAPGQARVRPVVVGICGSDVHAYHGVHPFIDLPVVPGHEVVGIVEEVAEDVVELSPGQRVLLEANLVDGTCPHCLAGRYNQCEHLIVVGCQTSGAMADHFVVPAEKLLAVPPEMSDDDAALVEPLASGTHAIRLAEGVEGRSVAVLGTGTIGLLTVAAARASGAASIASTDLLSSNRERAVALGADVALDPSNTPRSELAAQIQDVLGGRPDVTFDCVAVQETVDLAVELAQRGGTVVVLGVPTGERSVALPLVQDREVRIQGSAMYVREDVIRAMEIASSGALQAERIVTGRFGFPDAALAFEAAASTDHVKVQLYRDGP